MASGYKAEHYSLYVVYRVTGTFLVSLVLTGSDNQEYSSNLLSGKPLRPQVNHVMPFRFRSIKRMRQKHHKLINLESDMGDWGPLLRNTVRKPKVAGDYF